MRAVVAIGGSRLAVDAWAGGAPHLAALGPFLRPWGAADFELTLVEPPPPGPGVFPGISFQRPDLSFHLHGRRALAAIDDSLGAFEAALQLALEIALQDAVMLHASAAVVDGEAWLFPGPSGTGKSTCVRQGGFDEVLSDEVCILRRDPSHGFLVSGTPFWSADRPLPLNDHSVPLGLIAHLEKSPVPALTSLPPSEVAAALLRAVLLQFDAVADRTAAFDLVCDAALAIPAARLAFPKEGPWLTAVRAGASRAFSKRPSSAPCPSPCNGTSPGAAITSVSTAISSTGTRTS